VFREVVRQSVNKSAYQKKSSKSKEPVARNMNRKKDHTFWLLSERSSCAHHPCRQTSFPFLSYSSMWQIDALPIFASKGQGIEPKPNDSKEALSSLFTLCPVRGQSSLLLSYSAPIPSPIFVNVLTSLLVFILSRAGTCSWYSLPMQSVGRRE
jgi:hypothetical protein